MRAIAQDDVKQDHRCARIGERSGEMWPAHRRIYDRVWPAARVLVGAEIDQAVPGDDAHWKRLCARDRGIREALRAGPPQHDLRLGAQRAAE